MANTSILDTLKKTINLLKQEKCVYALAGGILVSGYREDVRATNDVDLLLLYENSSQAKADKILKDLGLSTKEVKIHDLRRNPQMNKKGQPAAIIVGRGSELDIGVDFILPEMPWFNNALDRAQSNLLDFGFGEIPCITLEDMIISKLYAGRDKDLDDLRSMFRKNKDIDLEYLIGEILKLQISVPKSVREYMPKKLQKIIKKKREEKSIF